MTFLLFVWKHFHLISQNWNNVFLALKAHNQLILVSQAKCKTDAFSTPKSRSQKSFLAAFFIPKLMVCKNTLYSVICRNIMLFEPILQQTTFSFDEKVYKKYYNVMIPIQLGFPSIANLWMRRLVIETFVDQKSKLIENLILRLFSSISSGKRTLKKDPITSQI